MDPLHAPMTLEAFRDLPRRLGWKHEYFAGKAHVTPCGLFVTLLLDVARRPAGGVPVRPLTLADLPALEPAFLAAFAGTMDYAGYAPVELQQAARRYFAGHFGEVRGVPLPASFLAEAGGKLLGAALIKRVAMGPVLDCVFAVPGGQRRGVATAVTAAAINRLADLGERVLYSFCMIGNGPSLAWHLRFGFRELPDLFVARHRAGFYRAELERHRRLGDLPPADLAEWARQSRYWLEEAERLEEIAALDPGAAHPVVE